jgi:C4-dicarboxylate transporter, DctM subunit
VSPELLVLVMLVALIALLAIGVPVAFGLLITGTAGIAILRSLDVAGSTVASTAYTTATNFSLVVIPLFVLLGYFVNHSRLGEQLFAVIQRGMHRLPGGLALASIFSCAGFGAVTGASMTGVATVGPIAVPQMRRHGYSDQLSTGVIAAAGTLGILIPPSIGIVIYGIITRESIERLLMAGIIPGIVSALVYALLTVSLVRYRRVGGIFGIRVDAPQVPREVGSQRRSLGANPHRQQDEAEPDQAAKIAEEVSWASPVLKIAALFFIVIGGIYFGIATVTESAAVGAFAALLILVHAAHRSGGTREVGRSFVNSVSASVSASAMLFMLLIGGSVFGAFLLLSGIPHTFAAWVTDLGVPPYMIVWLILLGFVALGTFLDGFSTMLIAVPLTHPVVTTTLGYDPLLFGILVIKAIEIGLITPPVGINAYVISGISKTPVERVFQGLLPFYIADVATIALLFAFPWLVTALPTLMRG